MRRLLDRLFSRPEAPPPVLPDPGPLTVPHPVIAVGDLHGRADLLDRIVDRARTTAPEAHLVFVGDYIDRGEESRATLGRLMDLSEQGATCLLGNHEDMLLKFLDDPEAKGGMWLRNGGLQTLASYGVGGLTPATRGLELARARDELVVAMGRETIDWLRARPLFWEAGTLAIVHAGADPALPMVAQVRENLIWGHRDFARKARTDGLWVMHGHTIVPEAGATSGRIAVDTGAYATGRLTAALVTPDDLRFLTA